VARILLPVVREIADQRAAEELEAAASELAREGVKAAASDDPENSHAYVNATCQLRARAAALRGEAGR
jgi:hypothetical protein